MKHIQSLTLATFLLALASCANQPTTQGRMGNVDCEALRNMDHSKMDHSSMNAEMQALHQQCGIEMNMHEGHGNH